MPAKQRTAVKVFKISIEEMGRDLPIETFIDLIDGLSKSLTHLSKYMSRGNQPFNLRVRRININSPGTIEVVPGLGTDPGHATHVITSWMSGARKMKARKMPEEFDETTYKDAKRVLTSLNGDIRTLKMSYSRKHLSVTSTIRDSISAIDAAEMKSMKESYGSIEGLLMLLRTGEKQEFQVEDVLLPKPVTCKVSPELMTEAHKHFGHRVRVFGLKRINKHGEVATLDVEELVPLPKDSEILPWDEVPRMDFYENEDVLDHLLGGIRG